MHKGALVGLVVAFCWEEAYEVCENPLDILLNKKHYPIEITSVAGSKEIRVPLLTFPYSQVPAVPCPDNTNPPAGITIFP